MRYKPQNFLYLIRNVILEYALKFGKDSMLSLYFVITFGKYEVQKCIKKIKSKKFK